MGNNNKNRKDKIKRCMATGKIVNGHAVILAEKEVIITYLKQMGYQVLPSNMKIFAMIMLWMISISLMFSPVMGTNGILINNPKLPLINPNFNNTIVINGGGGSGANTSLGNLETTTGINSNLIPVVTDTYNIGSFQRYWMNGLFSRLARVLNVSQTTTEGRNNIDIMPNKIRFNNASGSFIISNLASDIVYLENSIGIQTTNFNSIPTRFNIWGRFGGRVGFEVPDDAEKNYTLILPFDLGSDKQALLTNSTGGLYWGNEDFNYNQTYTLGTYNSTYDSFAYNQTYSGSTFNSTYDSFAYNQTYSGGTFNTTYDQIKYYNYSYFTGNYTNNSQGINAPQVFDEYLDLTQGDDVYIWAKGNFQFGAGLVKAYLYVDNVLVDVSIKNSLNAIPPSPIGTPYAMMYAIQNYSTTQTLNVTMNSSGTITDMAVIIQRFKYQ